MWSVALSLVLLACSSHLAAAANFETATVDGVFAITSEWNGGLCGSLMTRNPATNPSSSWAGLFTISGCELTTGPNGNGVSEEIATNQFTFVPTDPAQMAIFPNSTVMVTFCCNADNLANIKPAFRVIFSFDYRGTGLYPPPPQPPSPLPPPVAVPSPSPSPVAAPAPASSDGLVAGAPDASPAAESPSGAPEVTAAAVLASAGSFEIQEASSGSSQQPSLAATTNAVVAAAAPAPAPASAATATRVGAGLLAAIAALAALAF